MQRIGPTMANEDNPSGTAASVDNESDDVYPAGVKLRDWEDANTLRDDVFKNVHDAFKAQFPQRYGGVRLEVHDLSYEGPEKFSLAEQKEALMGNKYLHRKLVGTYKLFDDKTNQPLGEQRMTVMKVPYLTERGTWLHGGSEYSTINQSRLLPGVYTRRQANGELESHFNARRGTGHSFRIKMEPRTGILRVGIGQANLKLYSLLHDLGTSDEELEKHWGKELFATNKAKYDRRDFNKAFERLVRKPKADVTQEEKIEAIKKSLAETKLDRGVVNKTLPNLSNTKIAAMWKQAGMLPQSVGVSTVGTDVTPPSIMPQEVPRPEGIRKEDLIAIALLLNQQFDSGIPLDVTVSQLSDDIRQVITSKLPGLNPALAKEMQKGAGYDRYHVDRAAMQAATSERSDKPMPTQAQILAGNYQKGHVYLHGLDISIENPRGSIRSGTGPDGKKWSIVMKSHYGYVRRTVGADTEQIDIFVGPHPSSKKVFVVNQLKGNGTFDEHKVLLGFDSVEEAKAGYLANYSRGWKGLGSVVECSVSEFKKKLHLFAKPKHIESSLSLRN